MKNKSEALFWLSGIFVLGMLLGYWLSGFPKLEPYKLLSIIGLSYDFIGVLVLSEKFASNTTWKQICVNVLAPAILWSHTVIPLGATIGSVIFGQLMHKPSSGIVFKFAFGFFAYSILPLSFLNDLVAFPLRAAMRTNIERRFRWFGFILVLTGVGVQLISAILALIQ